jgi:hypothetical protein
LLSTGELFCKTVNPGADVMIDPHTSGLQGLGHQWCIVVFKLNYVLNCINCNKLKDFLHLMMEIYKGRLPSAEH